jgi:hypothetical protein
MPRLWYYREMGQEIGPLSPLRVLELVGEGLIGPETLVRKGRDGKWVPACKIQGLFIGSQSRPPAVDLGADNLDQFCPTPWAKLV